MVINAFKKSYKAVRNYLRPKCDKCDKCEGRYTRLFNFITSFEDDLDKFKTAFAKNYDLASRKFQTAIDAE